MNRIVVAATVLGSCITAALASGQTPDLSGTWRLDVERSRIAAAPLRGGADGGPADTLHVTHAANGTLIVGNQVNAGQAWSYRPGRKTTIPMGAHGTMAVMSRWEAGRFVSEGSRASEGGGGVTGVREVRSLSPDSRTLTVEVTIRTLQGERTNTLVYERVD